MSIRSSSTIHTTSSFTYHIRPAIPSDAPAILALIHGLAEYEREPNEVSNTVEQLIEDGWGKTPRFHAFMAEVDQSTTTTSSSSRTPSASSSSYLPVAFALSFFAYSTWKGTCLYLEDIYVIPEYRNHGIGLSLIKHCVHFASMHSCARVMWSALDWNTSAIDFYKNKIGAVIMKEWVPLRLTKEGIQEFLKRYPDTQQQQQEVETHTVRSDTVEGDEADVL